MEEQKLKCGLCGFEFEHGVKICRGCHGHVKYGAGGEKWFSGILFGGVAWYLLKKINDNLVQVNDDVAGPVILGAFILGVGLVMYSSRNQVRTVKNLDD